MRHKPVDGLGGEIIAVKNVDGSGIHVGNGILVDVAAVLEKEMLSCVKRLLGGRLCRTASPHDQMLQPAAIYMEYGVDYTLGGILGGFHKHASGSVAEKRACGAVLIVDHRRHFSVATTTTFLRRPLFTYALASSSATMKPAQAA